MLHTELQSFFPQQLCRGPKTILARYIQGVWQASTSILCLNSTFG